MSADYQLIAKSKSIMQPIFFALLAELKAREDYPESLRVNPELIGQYIHSVLPGRNVYFMRCREIEGSMRYLKIGISLSVSSRLSHIQSCCPLNISGVRYFLAGDELEARKVEKAILESVKSYSVGGEWIGACSEDEYNEMVTIAIETAAECIGGDPRLFTYDPTISNNPKDDYRVFLNAVWDKVIDEFQIDGVDRYLIEKKY